MALLDSWADFIGGAKTSLPSNMGLMEDWSSDSDDLSFPALLAETAIPEPAPLSPSDLPGVGLQNNRDPFLAMDGSTQSFTTNGHKRAKTEVQQPVLPSQLIMESNIAAELAKPAPTRAAAARTNQFLKSLSAEERRLLEAEGVNVPLQGPLSKEQERELKRLRRKIKNKLSAQDSRRRRKEYMSTLEAENQQLQEKVAALEKDKSTMSAQMKKIYEALRPRSQPRDHGRACMMVMFCLMLAAPSSMSVDDKKTDVDNRAMAFDVDSALEAAKGALDCSMFTQQQAGSVGQMLQELGLVPKGGMSNQLEGLVVKMGQDVDLPPQLKELSPEMPSVLSDSAGTSSASLKRKASEMQ